MVDLYLVSLLYRNDGGFFGHGASLKRAGSNEDAELAFKSEIESAGVKVLSVSSQKMKIGWY